jgi:hypothetical protein
MSSSDKEGDAGAFSFVDKRHRQEEPGTAQRRGGPSPAPEVIMGAPAEGERLEAPPVDFSTFLLSMASNAVYCLGGFQDPLSGKTSINLDQAKQSIDILTMMEEKTRGNLSAEEAKLLSHLLYDLRLKFVEASRR